MAYQKATVQDVARLAGLSTASVSRALSGARPVSPDVAERVARAAEQLGYRPDTVARSLRTRATATLGLVVADIMNPFFPLLMKAVEKTCRDRGLSLLLADAGDDVDVERECIDLLLDKRIDGLLISPTHRFLSQPAMRAAARYIPVVQLDRVADESLAFVRVDQGAAMGMVVGHLTSRGRSHLAFIGSDTSVSTSWERQVAFIEAATALDPRAATRVLSGDFSVEWGREATARILSLWPETDAIVCANDLIALGAMQELATRDLAHSIAISGFDDTIIATSNRITSVRQPLELVASTAIDLAEAEEKGARSERQMTLHAELMIRASTD